MSFRHMISSLLFLFSFRPIYLPRTIVNVLAFDVKTRTVQRSRKMLLSYKHAMRLSGAQLSALAVRHRWLGKLRHSGTEGFRSGQGTWHNFTQTRQTERNYFRVIKKNEWTNEWMNGLFRHVLSFTAKAALVIATLPAPTQASSAEWILCVSFRET